MAKNPTELRLYRSYDPIIRQHVPPRVCGKYGAERDPEILYAAGLPRDATPVLFVCRALNRAERETLEYIGVEKTRWRAAFLMGLVEIRNLVDEDGKPCTPSTWKPRRGGPNEKLDDEALEELEELGFGDVDFYEIGSAIEGMSILGKGVTPSCPLPASSRAVWNTPISSRRAAPSTDDKGQTEA